MNHKQMPRLGSAIASTILSLFSGVLVVGVDNAQAAVLNYKFQTQGGDGFFKVSNSSLTGIGVEEIAVSEGKFNGVTLDLPYMTGGKEFYDLATTARVIFYQGALVGLQAGGGESGTSKVMFPPNEYDPEPFFLHFSGGASWSIHSEWRGPYSLFSGYRDTYVASSRDGVSPSAGYQRYPNSRQIYYDSPVSYTLVDTEAEPVPEPLTAGGTALALAGLSWLKHKKKMAA
jgi:hypothetical protein